MEAELHEERQIRRKKKETKKAKPIAKIGQQPTSEYRDRNPSQRSPTGEKEEDTEAKTQKAMKIIPSECGSRTEQARRETGNPEIAQGRATAAKKGQQRGERRHNRPEQTAKKEKKNKPQES